MSEKKRKARKKIAIPEEVLNFCKSPNVPVRNNNKENVAPNMETKESTDDSDDNSDDDSDDDSDEESDDEITFIV